MQQQIKTGVLLTLILLGILLLGYVLSQLAFFGVLVLIAIVITTGIDPLVHRLQRAFLPRWEMPRALASLLVMLFGVFVVLGLFTALVSTAVTQSKTFVVQTWPTLQMGFIHWWKQSPLTHLPFIPQPDSITFQQRIHSGEFVKYLWTTTQALFGVLGGLASLILIVILTLFFTIAKDGIAYTFAQFIPPQYKPRVLAISHAAAEKMGGWLRGQIMLALIMTVVISVGMWLFGVREYSVLVGIIGGMGELIPMVGPYAAFIPALLIAIVMHFKLSAIISLVIFFVALSQVEAYYLSPTIMRRKVELHPVTTVVSLLIGGSLLGIVGAILAIPIAAAGRVIMLEAIFPAIQGRTRQEIEADGPEALEARETALRKVKSPPAPTEKSHE